jgi:hypothetical protein
MIFFPFIVAGIRQSLLAIRRKHRGRERTEQCAS